MKLLILSHEYPPIGGGGANACYFLSREFAKAGHLVTIVTAQYGNMVQTEQTSDGITIIRVHCKRKSKEKSTFFEMYTYLVNAWKLTDKLMNTSKFDKCLVFFGIPSGPIALHLYNKYHLPYIVRFGGGDIPGAQKRFKHIYKILSPVIRKIWKNSDCLIANSEGLCLRAQQFEKKYKILIVENGVDTHFFFPKKQNHKTNEIKILFVSRLIEGKGLQFIIPNITIIQKQVEQECGQKIKLLIVGDGPYKPTLQELVKKYHANHYVSFEGYKNKNQIRDYYQNSDIFILPSLSEGMPNVVLEAMACGLPIIMTPCEGSKELINNNGIISSLNEFADNLIKMCIDAKLREIMGQNSLNTVKIKFEWDHIGHKYLSILENPKVSQNKSKGNI